MRKNVFTAIAALALLASCSSTQKVASVSSLAGEWTIEQINGAAIDKKAGDNIPFLGFDTAKKRIYGNTGCNSLTGELKAGDGNIDLDNMGCTRMMCANMANEQKVLGALNTVKKYAIDSKGNLVLADGAGKAVIVLKKK